MAALTPEQAESIGPCISAFARSKKASDQVIVRDGESEREFISHLIHDAIDNGKPQERYVEVSVNEVEQLKAGRRLPEKSFLWVIDQKSIKIVREEIRNPARTLKPNHVCHTNLTGNSVARSGGEMFFCDDGRIYINPFSDRYGSQDSAHWNAVVDYFRTVFEDYEVVDILELIKESS